MNILYTCDNNYVWLMGISLTSLLINNSDVFSLDVHLIGENITKENKEKLSKLCSSFKRNIFFYDSPQFRIPDKLASNRWPKSAFSRLFCGEVLPVQIDKVLYLDCDTIITENLSQVFEIIDNEKPIYGVLDCIGKGYKKNIGLNKKAPYVNCGVLLLNLNLLRSMDMNTMIENFLSKYSTKVYYADQDIMNGTFSKYLGVLEPKYDVMSIEFDYPYKDILRMRKPDGYYNEKELNDAVSHPYIIHYTTNMLTIRPWYSNSDHPKKEEFLKYKNASPWAQEKLSSFCISKAKNYRLYHFLLKLPHKISVTLIGFIHAILVPLLKKFK